MTPEVALALLTTLAHRHPDKSPFGAYVRALPHEAGAYTRPLFGST